MSKLSRPLAIVGVLSLVAGFLAVGFSGVAGAATPPWQTSPPSQEVGGLLFYNSAGQQITGGSTTVAPFAAYVKGTTVLNGGDSQATLFGYTPSLQAPGNWSGQALGVRPHTRTPVPRLRSTRRSRSTRVRRRTQPSRHTRSSSRTH